MMLETSQIGLCAGRAEYAVCCLQGKKDISSTPKQASSTLDANKALGKAESIYQAYGIPHTGEC